MDEIKTKNKALRTLQSRKFLVSILMTIMAVGLYLMGQIDIEQMIGIIKPVVITYIGTIGAIDVARNILPSLKDILNKS